MRPWHREPQDESLFSLCPPLKTNLRTSCFRGQAVSQPVTVTQHEQLTPDQETDSVNVPMGKI